MTIYPPVQCDFYKTGHHPMYPAETVRLYSNLTPRKSRLKGVNHVVVFMIQYFCMEYLYKQWNAGFFEIPKEEALAKYKRLMDYTLGKGKVSTEHLGKLHDLGYLPIHIKALPEGSLCPIGVPCLTITNTVDHAFWLVNYLETILSCTVWQGITSATIAHEYKKLLNRYALETTGSTDFVQFQGHDFSMRGMSSLESACTSGAGHLLSFVGTDTIPAISFLESYYRANVETELVGTSVPATEHSVMCMGTKDDEIGTFRRLITEIVPEGIISIVSDTWDLWKVCTEYLPILKDEILARNGKVVIRPDSGDPVDIICGISPWGNKEAWDKNHLDIEDIPKGKGVIELLWDVFGGTEVKGNDGKFYKVLDPHIGAIYGDSITLDRAEAICKRLMAKGFASTNVVFGIGSYTYQYNTRDTFGFAMKATYGEIGKCINCDEGPCNGVSCRNHGIEAREIFKDPITDDGTKRSAKGLLRVTTGEGGYKLVDQQTWEGEKTGALETVFLDGQLVKFQTLAEIRSRLSANNC